MLHRKQLLFVCLASVGAAFVPSHPLACSRWEGGLDSTSTPINRRASPTSSRYFAHSASHGNSAKDSDEAPVSISTISTAALLIAGTTVSELLVLECNLRFCNLAS